MVANVESSVVGFFAKYSDTTDVASTKASADDSVVVSIDIPNVSSLVVDACVVSAIILGFSESEADTAVLTMKGGLTELVISAPDVTSKDDVGSTDGPCNDSVSIVDFNVVETFRVIDEG